METTHEASITPDLVDKLNRMAPGEQVDVLIVAEKHPDLAEALQKVPKSSIREKEIIAQYDRMATAPITKYLGNKGVPYKTAGCDPAPDAPRYDPAPDAPRWLRAVRAELTAEQIRDLGKEPYVSIIFERSESGNYAMFL